MIRRRSAMGLLAAAAIGGGFSGRKAFSQPLWLGP